MVNTFTAFTVERIEIDSVYTARAYISRVIAKRPKDRLERENEVRDPLLGFVRQGNSNQPSR